MWQQQAPPPDTSRSRQRESSKIVSCCDTNTAPQQPREGHTPAATLYAAPTQRPIVQEVVAVDVTAAAAAAGGPPRKKLARSPPATANAPLMAPPKSPPISVLPAAANSMDISPRLASYVHQGCVGAGSSADGHDGAGRKALSLSPTCDACDGRMGCALHVGGGDVLLAQVYDGHGGAEVARLAALTMVQ